MPAFAHMTRLGDCPIDALETAHIHSCLDCGTDWCCWATPCTINEYIEACPACEQETP